MAEAFSYTRFSSLQQATGDSLRRQTKLAQDYCKRNGLTLNTSTFHDHGISAFHGKNVVEGALGAFIEAVTKGSIPKGSYLLVESLDRISRNEIDEALELFLRLIRFGVVIVTLTPPEMVYSKEQIKADKGMSLIISLTVMMRAHEESAQKSARITASWKNKFDQAANNGTIFSAMAPSWLTPSADRKAWVINKPKAKVVQRIYKLALEGHGTPTIAKLLNDQGVPVMQRAARWTFGTVNALLKNEAVTGVYVPRKREGERIEGYYPPIIERTQFLLAREAMTQRRWIGGRSQKDVANLFAGMSFCAACGARMRSVGSSTITRESGETINHTYLRCMTSYSSSGKCDQPRFPGLAAERAILLEVTQTLANNIDRANNPDRVDPMVLLRADLETAQRNYDKLIDLRLALDDPKALAKRINDARATVEQITVDMAKAVAPVSRADETEFAKLVDALQGTEQRHPTELRRKMQLELRRIVDRVDFDCRGDDGSPEVRITYAEQYGSNVVYLPLAHLMQQVGGNRRRALTA